MPGLGAETSPVDAFVLPFDPWRLVHALRQRWLRVLMGALLVGGGVAALLPKHPVYQATAHLIRRESTLSLAMDRQGVPFKPQVLSTATLSGYLRSPDLLRRISGQARPPISPERLVAALKVLPEENPDVITFALRGADSPRATADLANLVAREVAAVTQEMQSREARDIHRYLSGVLVTVEAEFAGAEEALSGFLRRAELFNPEKETDSDLQQRSQVDLNFQNVRIELETIDLKVKLLKEEILNQKRGEIDALLIRYTDAYPLVQEHRAQLATLEAQLTPSTNAMAEVELSSPVSQALFQQIVSLRVQKVALLKQLEELGRLRERIQQKLTGLSATSREFARLNSQLESIRATRSSLTSRLREAQLFEANPLGYFLPLSTVNPEDVAVMSGYRRAVLAGLLLAALMASAWISLILLRELADERVKTGADVARVTRLPLLATLGEADGLNAVQMASWAQRTWTLLTAVRSPELAGARIWGFIASGRGEGCSTWIDALASAGTARGLHVIKVSTRLVPEPIADASPPVNPPEGIGASTPSRADWLVLGQTSPGGGDASAPWLRPPPGWTWNHERIALWQRALEGWRRDEGKAVLVELPPATDPSALLLAETLPELFWLTGSGLASASETRDQLRVLRSAGCRLQGAVLNREPQAPGWPRFPRWLARLTLALLCLGGPVAEGGPLAEPAPAHAAESATNFAFSVVTTRERAPWQEHLTLGPGDVLSVQLFGFADLGTAEVTIDPDGRIGYLQAQGVIAAGLTIDELRARLEQELARYYRNPRAIVTPLAFRSKKYYVLGAVVERGVFTLDRPMTVLEAVARAQGLATVNADGRSLLEASDLSNSVLIRRGQRMPVDLESLFRQGDLTQNIPLEPNDYLYFAPATEDEVYVLGQIRSPGIARYNPGATLIELITSRGGFVRGAHRKKILVVRGSLRRPEPYVVDAASILAGKTPDFRLQAKDIIFVSRSPWVMVGQVLDTAISTYLYALTVTWTSEHMEPLFEEPYVPGP
jgi:protein involved in polysaccharide export with SLBB domain/capsular polysaccharide biosynthesis protein